MQALGKRCVIFGLAFVLRFRRPKVELFGYSLVEGCCGVLCV